MLNCKCMLSVQVGWILSFLFYSGHVPYERKRSATYLKNNACIFFFFSSLFLIFSHSCFSSIVFPVTRNIFTILRCNTGQLVNIQRNHSELGTGRKLVSWANNCRPVRNVLMEYWVPIFSFFLLFRYTHTSNALRSLRQPSRHACACQQRATREASGHVWRISDFWKGKRKK